MDGISLKSCISYQCIILIADYLINICKDWVIFIRIFQSNMLISIMAQIHQNTLEIEAKTSCLFVLQAGNKNVCLGNT